MTHPSVTPEATGAVTCGGSYAAFRQVVGRRDRDDPNSTTILVGLGGHVMRAGMF
jgi:hypothetical protein